MRRTVTVPCPPLSNCNRAEVSAGSWLEGEAWRNEPDTGLFVILQKSFVGMVPASEPHSLTRGETARFRVSRVLAGQRHTLGISLHDAA